MKKFIKSIMSRLSLTIHYVLESWNDLLNSCVYIRYKESIVINAWVKIKRGVVVPNNWGDDINVPFIELITNKKVIIYNSSLVHKILKTNHYLCIGSLLGDYETEKSVIWGSGFISSSDEVKVRPLKICSVRGKLSRQKFLDYGVDCPKCYGDPALLLSRFYFPIVKKKYRVGIIPNHIDIDNRIINNFIGNNPNCILIELNNYEKWTDIIDLVLSCDYIISSSLHGLIISDSYCIPNDWVFFSDNIIGGTFKYLDYFSSVNRSEREPVRIVTAEQIENLIKNHKAKNEAKINFEDIINSCPFEIRKL